MELSSQLVFMRLDQMTKGQLQNCVVQWLDVSLPVKAVSHHSPNEGAWHISYKRRLKRHGNKWGWPDPELFIDDAMWLDNVKRLSIILS